MHPTPAHRAVVVLHRLSVLATLDFMARVVVFARLVQPIQIRPAQAPRVLPVLATPVLRDLTGAHALNVGHEHLLLEVRQHARIAGQENILLQVLGDVRIV